MEYKSSGRNGTSGLCIDTLKEAILTTKTKISIIDHFASQSNHKRMAPLLETESREGGMNHIMSVISCFV
jgi:hypothetical protein